MQREDDQFIYSAETTSGSLAKSTQRDLASYSDWADITALLHAPGNNTETLSLLEAHLLWRERPLVITSDVLLHFSASMQQLLNSQPAVLVATPGDLQKIITELKLPFALKQRAAIPHYIETCQKFISEYGNLTLQVLRDQTILTVSKDEANLTQTEEERSLHVVGSLATVLWLHNINSRYKAVTTAAFLALKADVTAHIKEKYN